MDNLPKGESTEGDQSQTSGEIFSTTSEMPTQTAEVSEETVPLSGQEQFQPEQPIVPLESPAGVPSEQYGAPSPADFPPSEGTIPPSPPFVEDERKKYIILVVAVVLVLLTVVFVISTLFRKKPKPEGPINLTYWGLWGENEVVQPIVDEYKRSHKNININFVRQDPKQYRERLQAAIARGEGPDLFRFHNSWVPMLIHDLSALPKTIYTNTEFEKTFYPVAIADLKVGDNFYGIPLEIDGLLLFYNEDILKGTNVSVPTTWADVQSAVSKLTVKEKDKIVTAAIALGTAENIEHFSDILGLMMLQNGVQLKKSLFSCSDSSTTTCGVETLSFYRKFAEAPNNSWDDTLDNSVVTFASGRVAMIFAPSWQVFTIKTMSPNLNFKTAPVPQLPCDKPPCPSVNWATYWAEGVSNKSKYQNAAWEFLKYLSQKSIMQKLYASQVKLRTFFGEPYSRVDLAQTLADNPYLAPLIIEAPTMKSFYLASRTLDGDTGLNSTLIKYLRDAVNSLSQGVSPETALRTADDGFKQVFTRFGINPSPAQ